MNHNGHVRFWTEERIEAAKRILREHDDMGAAREEMSRAFGVEITGDSLQKGFARCADAPASSFILHKTAPVTPTAERAGPSVLWSQAMLDEAAGILRGHTSLAEAAIDIGAAVGFPVTIDSMRVAFVRAKMGLPSSYLQRAAVGAKRLRDMTPLESAEYARDVKSARVDFRHQGRTEAVIEGIKDALNGLKPIAVNVSPRPAPTRTRGATECVWLTVSDVHVGHVTHPGSVGGIASHDHRDFLAKMDRWLAKAIETIEERQSCAHIDSVVVGTIGDLVDGVEIFRGQAWEQSHTIYDQLVDGSQAYGAALVKLASTFPHMRFSCYNVAGNHGRVVTPNNQPFRANFDLIAYAMIGAHIKASGVTNMTWETSDTFYMLVETLGLVHLLVHGDWIRASSGSPAGGLKAAKLKYTQLFESPIHYAHMGHWHSEACASDSSGDVLVSGSWIGTSEYSAKTLLEGQRPCQMAYGFNADGLAWTKKIYLRARNEGSFTPRIAKAGT